MRRSCGPLMLRRCAGEPDNIDLEDVWRIREEEIYPSLFGSRVRGIFPLQVRMFTRHFANQMWILGGFHYGVLEFAPSVTRHSWMYSASGLFEALGSIARRIQSGWRVQCGRGVHSRNNTGWRLIFNQRWRSTFFFVRAAFPAKNISA